MSKIGKINISIPEKVNVALNGSTKRPVTKHFVSFGHGLEGSKATM